MSLRILPPEMIEEARAMIAGGSAFAAVARHFKTAERTFKNNGVHPIPRATITPQLQATIIIMFEAGTKTRDIAAAMGYNRDTINVVIRDAGLRNSAAVSAVAAGVERVVAACDLPAVMTLKLSLRVQRMAWSLARHMPDAMALREAIRICSVDRT